MGLSFLVLVFTSPITREINAVIRSVYINMGHLTALARIGINTAMQFIFEVAAFAIAGLMAGSFGKEQIDAHGIALSMAAFTYMFGSGISGAATIRIGTCYAREDWREIKNAGVAALKLAAWVMVFFGLLFWLLHDYLPLAFSTETSIIELAAKLLIIAAMFQLFDGIQVTVIGILRGLQDVKIPTLVTLIGYWVIALPLAYFLAFTLKLEIVGIWLALLSSLVFVAIALLWRLKKLVERNLTGSANT
jgi:MATE family multidrug resistance protein